MGIIDNQSNKLSEDSDFVKLQFSQEWIDAGIVTTNNFTLIKQEYLKGEDEATEHYRYGAFHAFMRSNKNITSAKFYILYKIGKGDLDYSMGRAIIFDIIKHSDCPKEIIEIATKDKDVTLAKHVLKYKIIRDNKET